MKNMIFFSFFMLFESDLYTLPNQEMQTDTVKRMQLETGTLNCKLRVMARNTYLKYILRAAIKNTKFIVSVAFNFSYTVKLVQAICISTSIIM